MKVEITANIFWIWTATRDEDIRTERAWNASAVINADGILAQLAIKKLLTLALAP